MRHPKYVQSLAEMPPGLERDVWRVLTEHVGSSNRISRYALACEVFHVEWPSETQDRQVRTAISRLQAASYPAISDSGYGGYWIATRDEIETYIAEIESRREMLAEKVRGLRRADKLAWVEPKKPSVQGRLF